MVQGKAEKSGKGKSWRMRWEAQMVEVIKGLVRHHVLFTLGLRSIINHEG